MRLEEILPEIRNGRKYRHKSWTYFTSSEMEAVVLLSHLLSNDWELEPIKIEITKEDLARAWDKEIWEYSRNPDYDDAKDSVVFKRFCKELGIQ